MHTENAVTGQHRHVTYWIITVLTPKLCAESRLI